MTENNNKSKAAYPTIFVAIIILVVIALAASLYFSGSAIIQPASSTGSSNTNSTATTGPSGSNTTVITTTTSNITITPTSRRTTEYRTFTGKMVAIDSSLQVQTIQSILLTGNATQIAQRLASALNELPITLVSEQMPHGSNNTINAFQATYNYRTSKDSHISITFLYWNNQFQFYQLGYTVKNYTNLRSADITPNNSSMNVTKAESSAEQIMSGLGIPFAQVTLVNRNPLYSSATDYMVEWVQGYKGIPMSGTIVTNWAGGRSTVPSTLELEFYPPTGELIGISIFGPYWYLIPASFPLDVQPSTAISTAVNTANSQLNMSQVTYTNAALVAMHGHLYYVISVGNGIIEYSIYINPRTGEVGFPQP
ncbi:MAG: PepSY domain-containing protein [Thaumarchaeota archaeon]|nr:PepSY domain-containing protein [Nitrososphaerota archaeon]